MVGRRPLRTLAVDIGGTHIKASVLDSTGHMTASEVRLDTPAHPTPDAVLKVIKTLAAKLPAFDRIAAGFPGYIAHGEVRTAPNLGTDDWRGFPLTAALQKHLRKPARVLNDADVQGLGIIEGQGLECVLTLGTGIGSALFNEGILLPHLELGQHPIKTHKTYDQYLGDAALKAKGEEKWNKRLLKAIAIVSTLINYDWLYLGGGNALAVHVPLPPKVRLAPNSAGITGGVKLWGNTLDSLFAEEAPKKR
jgi:polyphosphate glucokinase